MCSMSDPIITYPIWNTPIKQWNTPYPATEYPISLTEYPIFGSGINLFPQWNTPYPALEYQVFRHWIEIITDTSTPPPPAPPHKITLRLYPNHTPTLPKSYSDLTKIILRLYQHHTPILPKITGWFSQNHTPTLPKSHSDFTKITLRLYQNHWLILTKSYSDFTKIKPWLCLKPPIPSYNYIFKIKWKHQHNTYLSPSFSML